eukprot:scaffold3672_cov86-Cylindrotheca_fusiformis.AAC.4
MFVETADVSVIFFLATSSRAERGGFELPLVLPLHQWQDVIDPSDAEVCKVVGMQVAAESIPVDLGTKSEVPVVCLAQTFQLSFVVGMWEVSTAVESDGMRDGAGDGGLVEGDINLYFLWEWARAVFILVALDVFRVECSGSESGDGLFELQVQVKVTDETTAWRCDALAKEMFRANEASDIVEEK